MKLRLEKGIIKARLSKEEILELRIKKTIYENFFTVEQNQFSFSVQIKIQTQSVKVSFENNELIISINEALAKRWADSSQIGVRETIETSQGEFINIIVEEDLPPRKMKQRD